MKRYLRRIETALRELDLGISEIMIRTDFLKAVNTALRQLGAPKLKDLNTKGSVMRAMITLEQAIS